MPKRHFSKGQSTFKCRMCGKTTRDVGDNGSVELCPLCEAKSLNGNSLSDSGFKGDACAVFDACKTPQECDELLTKELDKLAKAIRKETLQEAQHFVLAVLLCFALLLVSSVASAATEAFTTRLYDKFGTYQGRLVVRKGETKFYGASGTYQGRASTTGGTTKFYDKSGTLKGSAKK